MMHGYMVYTERAETAAVSCGTSHASAVSTPLRWIFKRKKEEKERRKKERKSAKKVTHVESHASAVNLLKRAENSAV